MDLSSNLGFEGEFFCLVDSSLLVMSSGFSLIEAVIVHLQSPSCGLVELEARVHDVSLVCGHWLSGTSSHASAIGVGGSARIAVPSSDVFSFDSEGYSLSATPEHSSESLGQFRLCSRQTSLVFTIGVIIVGVAAIPAVCCSVTCLKLGHSCAVALSVEAHLAACWEIGN